MLHRVHDDGEKRLKISMNGVESNQEGKKTSVSVFATVHIFILYMCVSFIEGLRAVAGIEQLQRIQNMFNCKNIFPTLYVYLDP